MSLVCPHCGKSIGVFLSRPRVLRITRVTHVRTRSDSPAVEAVVAAVGDRTQFRVRDVLRSVQGEYTKKEIYNVLGYLVRRRELVRVGYGLYEVPRER